jgi:hypothetical protein
MMSLLDGTLVMLLGYGVEFVNRAKLSSVLLAGQHFCGFQDAGSMRHGAKSGPRHCGAQLAEWCCKWYQ